MEMTRNRGTKVTPTITNKGILSMYNKAQTNSHLTFTNKKKIQHFKNGQERC